MRHPGAPCRSCCPYILFCVAQNESVKISQVAPLYAFSQIRQVVVEDSEARARRYKNSTHITATAACRCRPSGLRGTPANKKKKRAGGNQSVSRLKSRGVFPASVHDCVRSNSRHPHCEQSLKRAHNIHTTNRHS